MSAPDRVFREQVRHLHRLGPRPVGEILAEVLAACPTCRGLVLERLDRFGEMDPHHIDLLGAADWLDQRQLVRAVAGGAS